MKELKIMIAKKIKYLLSLNSKDGLILGQLLGLKCVLEYIEELEKEETLEIEKMR